MLETCKKKYARESNAGIRYVASLSIVGIFFFFVLLLPALPVSLKIYLKELIRKITLPNSKTMLDGLLLRS